ncbi:titin-like [Patiria miniata]|uniref:Ig-like domain-containing protein n=1 Tax=Patiria miniata TaxID=46514 RepID=A0A914BRC0_PATMI|nr:titin-like [Patiria miniata]
MHVTEMASQMRFVRVLRWLSLLLIASTSANGQMITLIKKPPDEYTLQGEVVVFECTVTGVTDTTGTQMKWYKDAAELNCDGRFVIEEHSLIINNIVVEDAGMYSCRYGNASKEGTLNVLPSSWKPRCDRSPSTGSITTGDQYVITCTSTGHINTSLRWFGSGSSNTLDVKVERREKTVSISYNSTVQDSTSQLLFICEANLGSLELSCSINFESGVNNQNVIPFVVVGLMSLIALLLFFVVLFFLLRRRQCRFCREPMLEPIQILDANSLQTGAWIPPPVVAIDMEVSEDGESVKDAPHVYEDMERVSLPPDVVPAQEPTNDDSAEIDVPDEAPIVQPEPETVPAVEAAPVAESPAQPKSKKKNLTITKNINQNFDKPTRTLEKKAVPVTVPPSVIKPRPTHKRQKKVIKHYKESPVKARIKTPKEPIYAQVKKLNVPSKSVPSKPADDIPSTSTGAETSPAQPPILPPRPSSEDFDSKDASSTATGETDSTDQTTQLENDLGRGNSKKKRIRHYRKKSEDIKKNSGQGDVVLNIQATKEELPKEATQSPEESSGTSKKKKKNKIPADRVIYAELDFSKEVGLNILE